MVKAINDHLSSDFHGIINSYLEDHDIRIIKQDIDSGILKVDDSGLSFAGFYEVKRSFNINKWRPYREDANNYFALSKLSGVLGIDCFILFYEKNKLNDNGVKIFRINGLDRDSMFKLEGIVSISKLRLKLLQLSNLNYNEFREKALQGTNNNIYAVLNYFSNYNHLFYSESDTSWWMLLSDPKTFMPIAIYKEIKNYETKESILYDGAFLKIAHQINLPIFKFIYSDNSKNIDYFEDLKTGENYKDLKLEEFLIKYVSYIDKDL